MSVASMTTHARNAIRDRKPVAWAVMCPPGHEYDWWTYFDLQEARHAAWEFADEAGEDDWLIYPLFAGEPFAGCQSTGP